MVFGKQVLEDQNPAGLKRMNKTDWPDQYPPLVGEDAAPVEGDAPEAAALRPLLKQTQLEFQPLALAYDAEQHGWSADAFHAKLDGLGAAVLILETAGGAVCGGYNPKGWLGYGDWRDAISAFLFTWPDGNTAKPALKLPKTVRPGPSVSRIAYRVSRIAPRSAQALTPRIGAQGGSGMAIIDEQGGGPQWGPEGLKVSVGARSARSRLGTYYERRPGGGRSLFTDDEGSTAEVVSLRAWVGVGVAPGTEGYKPSMLQWQPGELEKLREQDAKRGER
jgi:hypothetical protein